MAAVRTDYWSTLPGTRDRVHLKHTRHDLSTIYLFKTRCTFPPAVLCIVEHDLHGTDRTQETCSWYVSGVQREHTQEVGHTGSEIISNRPALKNQDIVENRNCPAFEVVYINRDTSLAQQCLILRYTKCHVDVKQTT